MAQIAAGGVKLNVVERGQGPVLLLVHGFPLDHSMWRQQLEGLSGQFRVIAPDLRGFGQSEVTGGEVNGGKVTMAQYADDLAALLDAMKITEPVVLCGLSMGGYIAWQFWQRHVSRLRALILCDTRAIADSEEAARGRLATAQSVTENGPGAVVESMLPKLFAESTQREQPEIVAGTRAVMEVTSPEGIAAALRGMAERPDMTAELGQIRVPTLCLVGEHDVISPAAEMQGFSAAIPGARFCRIDNAGHMAPLEQPAAVNAAIRQFMQSLPKYSVKP